jgi:ubiquinone/menaquinone biosynthesis C-methylase UbiE
LLDAADAELACPFTQCPEITSRFTWHRRANLISRFQVFRRNQSTELIRHHWDRRADTFDEESGHGLFSEEQREAWHHLLSRLVGRAPQRALDVGCGTGFLALRLAELGHTVEGVDLSEQMIAQARDKAEQAALEIEFRVGDAADLDSADEAYDLVVARHVIWNLPDPEAAVAEWLRVLCPRGRLLLVEGKWADNEAAALSERRPAARLLAWVLDRAALVVRSDKYRTKLLSRKYWQLEVQLPFAGGPTASRLVSFLQENSVDDVSTESLMDPALWGELPHFPRYVVTGTRGEGARRRRRVRENGTRS